MAQPTPKINPKTPAKNGFNYKPKFGLIIQCDDEPQNRL